MTARWRVGRQLGRTLYVDDAVVGMVDTPELAAAIVEAMNDVEAEMHACPPCEGTGMVQSPRMSATCFDCDGSGRVRRPKTSTADAASVDNSRESTKCTTPARGVEEAGTSNELARVRAMVLAFFKRDHLHCDGFDGEGGCERWSTKGKQNPPYATVRCDEHAGADFYELPEAPLVRWLEESP